MDSALYESLTEWSAETLYPSRIGHIGRAEFYRFAERHPELYRIASKELIGTLQHACSTLRILGLSSCVRKRLASQLLAWGERGSKTGDQAQFRMALTHAQIAEFIGTARESVTRGLIAFKQRGLVEVYGSMMRIPSTKALRRYAEGG
jgi:CRP/FNR family transcriptional regulator